MSENASQHEPKLSEADIIIGTILMLALDAGDWFEAGVPGTDLVGFPTEQIFLNKKGVKGTTALIGNAIELIPGIDYMPVRTIAWLITVWMDRHPSEFSEKIEQVGEHMQKAEGKAGAGQGALQAKGAGAGEATSSAGHGATTSASGGGAESAANGNQAPKEAGESAQNKKTTGEEGSGSVRDKARKESGGESGEESEGGESGEENKEESIPDEQKEIMEILSGDYVGRSIRENLGAEQFLSEIGNEELGAEDSDFDSEKMGPEMTPKPARKWAPANDNQAPKNMAKGIINSEQVNLKNAPQKNKELLQDAA